MHKDLFIETFVASFLATYAFSRYSNGLSRTYSIHIEEAYAEAELAWEAKIDKTTNN